MADESSVWVEVLREKLNEISSKLDRMEERFEHRVSSESAELRVLIVDQEKRLRALELWRWGLLAASGAGVGGSISAVLKALVGSG